MTNKETKDLEPIEPQTPFAQTLDDLNQLYTNYSRTSQIRLMPSLQDIAIQEPADVMAPTGRFARVQGFLMYVYHSDPHTIHVSDSRSGGRGGNPSKDAATCSYNPTTGEIAYTQSEYPDTRVPRSKLENPYNITTVTDCTGNKVNGITNMKITTTIKKGEEAEQRERTANNTDEDIMVKRELEIQTEVVRQRIQTIIKNWTDETN